MADLLEDILDRLVVDQTALASEKKVAISCCTCASILFHELGELPRRLYWGDTVALGSTCKSWFLWSAFSLAIGWWLEKQTKFGRCSLNRDGHSVFSTQGSLSSAKMLIRFPTRFRKCFRGGWRTQWSPTKEKKSEWLEAINPITL